MQGLRPAGLLLGLHTHWAVVGCLPYAAHGVQCLPRLQQRIAHRAMHRVGSRSQRLSCRRVPCVGTAVHFFTSLVINIIWPVGGPQSGCSVDWPLCLQCSLAVSPTCGWEDKPRTHGVGVMVELSTVPVDRISLARRFIVLLSSAGPHGHAAKRAACDSAIHSQGWPFAPWA